MCSWPACGKEKIYARGMCRSHWENGRRRRSYTARANNRAEYRAVYAANPQACRDRVRAWRQANPDRVRSYQHSRKHSLSVVWTRFRYDLKLKGYACELERSSFEMLQGALCALCDEPGYGPLKIHRIDEAKGFTADNCVSCCRDCSRLKRAFAPERFRAVIERIHSKLVSQ